MDESETRKKEVASDADRADPGDSGGWFFLKGADAIRVLRAFARWTLVLGALGLVLLSVALYRFWFVPDFLRNIQERVGR